MGGYRIVGCVGVLLILISLLPLTAGEDVAGLKVGDKAPLFNANDHLGHLWRAGKIVYINTGVNAAEDSQTVIEFLKSQN